MLIGKWKNFEELEESVNIDELNLLVKAIYERERRGHKFFAAMKGIKLDDPEEDVQTRFERAQFRAEARLKGMTEPEIEEAEEANALQSLGFNFSKQ